MSKAQKRGAARAFIICLALSILTILAISTAMTAVLMAGSDPTGKIGIFSPLTLILSAIIGGIISAKMRVGDGIGFSLTVAFAVCLVMLIFGMILSGGKIGGGAFMNYLCYFAIYSLLSYLVGRRRSVKKRGRLK